MIKTRTAAQCRSHAQKYFAKLENEKAANLHGGAAELHGAHVVLDNKKPGKKRRRSSLDAPSTTTGKKKRKSSKKRSQKHHTLPKAASGSSEESSAGGSAAPAGRAVGGLPADPYCFTSIPSCQAYVAGQQPMMLNGRGPSPVTHLENGRSQSPKTARVAERPLSRGDTGFTNYEYGSDQEMFTISNLIRDREELIRQNCGKKIPALGPDLLQKVADIDEQILQSYNCLKSQGICVCRRLCHIVYCQEAKRGLHDASKPTSRRSNGCITAQRDLLFFIQSSLTAYPVMTQGSTYLLQMWQQMQSCMQALEMSGNTISIDQTATIYSTMSEKAQNQLHDLDETELTAVQVLVGTKMGLKPRKSPIRLNSSKLASMTWDESKTKSPTFIANVNKVDTNVSKPA